MECRQLKWVQQKLKSRKKVKNGKTVRVFEKISKKCFYQKSEKCNSNKCEYKCKTTHSINHFLLLICQKRFFCSKTLSEELEKNVSSNFLLFVGKQQDNNKYWITKTL